MSTLKCSKDDILRWPAFAAMVASVGSGCSAFAGWAGAKILDSSGYDDYSADTSRATAAVGGAVLTGIAGLIAYPFIRDGVDFVPHYKRNIGIGVVAYVADVVISSMFGQAIQSAADKSTLDFEKQVAASAVGAPVSAITIAVGAACLFAVGNACIAARSKNPEPSRPALKRRKKKGKSGASATVPAGRPNMRAGAFFPQAEKKREHSLFEHTAV